MSKAYPIVPRLNLTSASDDPASNVTVSLPADFIPRPPAAPPKSSNIPSLRQSNTALVPQITPAMIGQTSDCSHLSYKKILRGRLGVRTHPETHRQPSKPCQPVGSQTFRSTMEVLNSRCGYLSARTSASASSSEMNRVSESASSMYERRSQALSAFGAPFYGFCATPNEQNGISDRVSSHMRLRPQSSGQHLIRPWTGAPYNLAQRPTTGASKVDVVSNSDAEIRREGLLHSQHKHQFDSKTEVNSSKQNICSSPVINPNLNSLCTSSEIATRASATSSTKGKVKEQNEPVFLFPSQGLRASSIVISGDSINVPSPSLEQAISELTKGHSLKKFSHVSQRVAIKVMRVNSNAELLIDDKLCERVVAIFDGLSLYVPPKQSLNSPDDFVPSFHMYNFNPAMAFHILLMNEEFVDVIADSAWTKQCWMSGIRLMLAQMKSKFQHLPVRLPDFDTDDLVEEAVRRMKWLEFLRATTDRLEDERKKKEATLCALELKEKETSNMYDAISKPVGLDRISDLNKCVARMEFLNIQLDQAGITLKHQETEQFSTTQVCKAHLQDMSSIVSDATTYVQFIRSQWNEVVQQTRRLEIERNCFKDFFYRNRKEIIDRLKHRRLFHQQIKNDVEAMEFSEKNRGAAILERSRKNEAFVDDRPKRHIGANVSLLSFFQGGIDSSSLSSFPKLSSMDSGESRSFLLLKGSLVSSSEPPRDHNLTLKSGFEWMMVTAGVEDLSAFVQRIISQKAVGVALRAASETSLSARDLKIEDLNVALSKFSSVHSAAAEPTALDDIPDISKLISSSVSRIRDLEIAIRWHQRKEALFIGYTEEARIALQNINQRLHVAFALNPASKVISISSDSRSRSRNAKKPTEISNEPLITLLFSNLCKNYDTLLSCAETVSVEATSAFDSLVELTMHNTRVEITDSDGFPEIRSADHTNPVVAPVITSLVSDDLLNAQPAKPKTPSGVAPVVPSVQFKYRKAESKKFKIPRMFQHLEWEKNDAEDVSLSSVGLYDKNGRRVRIARKKQEVQVLDEIEDGSSDDSSGVPDFDTLKVVSKRAIKEQARRVLQENLSAQQLDLGQTSN